MDVQCAPPSTVRWIAPRTVAYPTCASPKTTDGAVGAACEYVVAYACQLAPPSVVSLESPGDETCSQRMAVTNATAWAVFGAVLAYVQVPPASVVCCSVTVGAVQAPPGGGGTPTP